MNLKKLEILMLIDKHKKITKVAEILDMKQPTVTFHMKTLEKEFGIPLFQNKSRNILLTEAGKALLHYARKMKALEIEANRVVDEYHTLKKGHLTIGASSVPATYLIPKLMGDFKKAYPAISLSLIVKTAPAIHNMLSEHAIDIGVIAYNPIEAMDLEYKKLCEDQLLLVYSPENRLSQIDQVTLNDIEREAFILHSSESTTRSMTDEWAKNVRIHITPMMELGSTEAIKQVLMSGIGVSILSKTAVKQEIHSGDLLYHTLPGHVPERHIYLLYHKERYLSPLMKKFIDHLGDINCGETIL